VENVARLIATLVNSREPITIGPLSLDPSTVAWDRLPEQLLGMVEPLVTQSGGVLSRLATSTARTVFNLFFIFVLSIYLASDLPRFGGYVKSFAQRPGYREDAEQLLPRLRHVWSAYLRGQIVLSLVIFLTVWIGLTLLGVQNSLALGLLAGLLEFLPNLGPVISAVVTILVAFFQPGNYLGLASWQYTLVVLALMIVIQQLENHLLVPRIVGGALNLHPIIVIVGLFIGASLGGILGAILAAPLIASIKVLSQYAWRKLFDLPPFPVDEPLDDPPPHPFHPE